MYIELPCLYDLINTCRTKLLSDGCRLMVERASSPCWYEGVCVSDDLVYALNMSEPFIDSATDESTVRQPRGSSKACVVVYDSASWQQVRAIQIPCNCSQISRHSLTILNNVIVVSCWEQSQIFYRPKLRRQHSVSAVQRIDVTPP